MTTRFITIRRTFAVQNSPNNSVTPISLPAPAADAAPARPRLVRRLTFNSISTRFQQTIQRAADGIEDPDHPLRSAARALVDINLPRIETTIPQNRPRIVFDTIDVDHTGTVGNETRCSICLADYSEGESCGVLPCNHNYHENCIREWVDSKRTCPICRFCFE